MAIPQLAAALAPTIAGTVGGLLAKKRKIRLPDQSAILRTGQDLTQNLAKTGEQFRSDTGSLADALSSRTANLGETFKTEAADLGTQQAANLSNTLRQNVLTAQPELQRGLRETLAATGGLKRGASTVAASRLGQAAANQIGQGEALIQQQRLQGLQDATNKVFGANLDAVTRATGLNADALSRLFESGRSDLIREAQIIMDLEQNRGTRQLASDTARAQGQNALLQALLQQGGQAVGSFLGRRGVK